MTRSRTRAVKSAPTPYHHGDLRNALISEGRRLLEELGAHELSLRHVARSVGVSIAAPSYHFESKEHLLAAIAAEGFNELAALRSEIAASTVDPMIKVFRMMQCYVRFAERERGLFDLMVGTRLPAMAYEDLAAASVASFELFASTVCDFARTKGWAKKDLDLVLHAAWSVEHGLAALILAQRVPFPGHAVDVQQMINFSISTMLSGISAGPDLRAAIAKVAT
ncbi:TetR/AcrR family transcriptional regulator [Paraburkholderia sp. MM5482-R1]|uniref:TetR/AcrR family transcriptional regulator n=1 Tax=unclassified Paraburkholderia TaxID=2615204 RepID=UPI003D1A597C